VSPPPGDGTIRIVIADDQPVVRAGLRMLLEGEGDFEVVGETLDIVSTEQSIAALRADVVVLDAHIPGELGVTAIPELVAVCPDTAIVVLTGQDDVATAREALRAGARGYVLKHSAGIELIDAVRTAVAGETYLNPILGARMAAEAVRPHRKPGDLTDRETEVLRLIALGHTNAEIAQQLYLSVRTVESHRSHIQQKLRLSTRAELVRYALDSGLIGR
jgi:two-component system, NarL family, response regulator NreC